LIDGEMPAAALQERLNGIVEAEKVEPGKGMFRIIAGDLEEFGIGNLADAKIQREVAPSLAGSTSSYSTIYPASPRSFATTIRKPGTRFKRGCYRCGVAGFQF
jgi:hypothetical protein